MLPNSKPKSTPVQSPSNGRPTSSFRVFIYSRVSSPHQAQHGHSLEAQPEDLRAWAQAQGWHVVGELTDPGRTGRTADREGFNELMEALRAQRPDAVLVTRLSRFMRNARLTLNAVHEMRELGVALVCKDEPIDTRQRGISDMFLAILATLAEWESDRLSEYAKATHQRLISKGQWPAGSPPFGYHYDKETHSLTVNPERAEVVRLIFSLYVDRHIGMDRVIRELAARGVPAPKGGRIWNKTRISKILADPIYIGRHRLGISAPSIIDKDVFDRAQRHRATNWHMHPARKDPWPLQGRLRCSECGTTLRCDYSKGHRYYRCPGRLIASRHYLETGHRCSLPGRRGELVEKALLMGIINAFDDPDNLALALEASIHELRIKATDLSRDVTPLQEARKAVETELSRLSKVYARGHLSDSEFDDMEREALDRRDRIQARLDAVSPGDLAELERTQRSLHAAEYSLELSKQMADGSVHGPAYVVLPLGLSGGRAVDNTEEFVTWEPLLLDDPSFVASDLRAVLDRLQGEVIMDRDNLTLRGLVALTVPVSVDEQKASVCAQAFPDPSGSRRCSNWSGAWSASARPPSNAEVAEWAGLPALGTRKPPIPLVLVLG